MCVRAQAKSCMIELLLDNCTREQRERDAQTQIDCAEIGTIGAQRIGHVVSEVRAPPVLSLPSLFPPFSFFFPFFIHSVHASFLSAPSLLSFLPSLPAFLLSGPPIPFFLP